MTENPQIGKPSGQRIGYWRTREGYETYARAYQRAMSSLPTPSEQHDVETDVGSVRVYGWVGPNPEAPARVLLPGRTSGVPMRAANLPGLIGDRTVYALDVLGDTGMSVQTRPLADSDDQASWLDAVVSALGAPRVHLVGHSFGGWLAANYAAHRPARVASLALLEPVFVFSGLPVSVILKTIPASVPFLPQRLRRRMLASIGGAETFDASDPVAAMIDAGVAAFHNALPLPNLIRGSALAGVPTSVALADRSVMHRSSRTAGIARDTLPGATVTVWPNTTHYLPMEIPGPINDAVIALAAAHDDER